MGVSNETFKFAMQESEDYWRS